MESWGFTWNLYGLVWTYVDRYGMIWINMELCGFIWNYGDEYEMDMVLTERSKLGDSYGMNMESME